MTLSEVYTMLNGIQGFSGKVVYYQWPVDAAPALPFIVYLSNGSDNFAADNKVYYEKQQIYIELYTKTKDQTTEAKVEETLNNNSLYWEKNELYIDNEKCYQITYEIEV